jgi:hypothetical protein
LGIVCLALGFRSLGVSLFREAGLLLPAEVEGVERALAGTPLRRVLKHAWSEVPVRAGQFLAKARRLLSRKGGA